MKSKTESVLKSLCDTSASNIRPPGNKLKNGMSSKRKEKIKKLKNE